MITFQDNTIRDGMQQSGINKNLRTRIQVIEQIKDLKNITSVEIGMCTTIEDQRLLAAIISHMGILQRPVVLTRLNKRDIELTKTLTQERSGLVIKLLVPTSELHIREKLGITVEELKKSLQGCLQQIENSGIGIDICIEDATRTDRKTLFNILDICDQYPIRFVTIADTVGCSTPFSYGQLIKEIMLHRYSFEISVHCHNDLGMATANAFSGIMNGATQAETTFLGIGERAGNTALDEIAYLAHKMMQEKDLDIPQIVEISYKMQNILGQNIPSNKALLGENVFLHEAGIHQNGCLKNREMYQFVLPEEIGMTEKLNFGISGLSSSKVIRNKIADILGSDQGVEEILALYRNLSKTIKNISIEEAVDSYLLDIGRYLV